MNNLEKDEVRSHPQRKYAQISRIDEVRQNQSLVYYQVHGQIIYRGQTQALSTTTLGPLNEYV